MVSLIWKSGTWAKALGRSFGRRVFLWRMVTTPPFSKGIHTL